MLTNSALLHRIVRSTDAFRARARAARYIRGGTAVILDTETTDLDGYCVEISIINAATGRVLFNTLVNPQAPISDGATAIHHLTAADLTDAPTWPDIADTVRSLLHNRIVLAYNAPFDKAVLAREWERSHLPEPGAHWQCLAELRRQHEKTARRRRLGGGHRALDDCLHAYRLLHTIANRRPVPGACVTP
jgi:DNA polymerase III epsilon subunit-like protein